MASADLMPASGHQDHTTSPSAKPRPRQKRRLASIASRAAFVTIAIAPLIGRDGGINKAVSTKRRSGIFFAEGLDSGVAKRPDGQITWAFPSQRDHEFGDEMHPHDWLFSSLPLGGPTRGRDKKASRQMLPMTDL
jgi:hypothetical protein